MSLRLYENVVIGNVLYGLGFAIGAHRPSRELPSIVNLMQQTPLDTGLADLLVAFPGVIRLIEFKASPDKGKERERRDNLLKYLQDHPKKIDVSRDIHWFIHATPATEPSVAVTGRIVPYIDAFNPAALTDQRPLDEWVAELAASVIAQPEEETSAAKRYRECVRDYLLWLKRLQGSGEVGTGGVLLAADKRGAVRYVSMVDCLGLRHTLKQWMCFEQARRQIEIDAVVRLDREVRDQRRRTLQKDQQAVRAKKGLGR